MTRVEEVNPAKLLVDPPPHGDNPLENPNIKRRSIGGRVPKCRGRKKMAAGPLQTAGLDNLFPPPPHFAGGVPSASRKAVVSYANRGLHITTAMLDTSLVLAFFWNVIERKIPKKNPAKKKHLSHHGGGISCPKTNGKKMVVPQALGREIHVWPAYPALQEHAPGSITTAITPSLHAEKFKIAMFKILYF